MTTSPARFPIVASSIAVSVLALCIAFVLGATVASSDTFEHWFNRYQTIIAALIAIAAAIIAALQVQKQLRESQVQTKIQAFESLYRIGFKLKECEFEAEAFRVSAGRFVIVESTFRALKSADDGILKMTSNYLENYENELSNKINVLKKLDSFRLQPSPPSLDQAIVKSFELLGYATRIKTKFDVAVVELNAREQRLLEPGRLQELQGFSMKDLVSEIHKNIDSYLLQLRQELLEIRARIGLFDFTN